MVVDLLDYVEKIAEQGGNIKQKELCSISGVNRYTISMAMNQHDGIYNMKPDGVYRLFKAHPTAITLPDDFTYYSTASFKISTKASNSLYQDIADKVEIPKTSISRTVMNRKNYFIYDKKEYFTAFEKLYVPMLGDDVAMEYPEEIDPEELILNLDKAKEAKGETDEAVFITNLVMYNIETKASLIREAKRIYKGIEDAEIYTKICSLLPQKYDINVVSVKKARGL